ncbi:hypothetical protein VTN49DRAFT_5990 [Thermomyces lanuginosus]|uniref:uncharacterized protein n=1 Tax=Thermomyces lanuginosus TaxID=5541 RepID=UPI003744A709
MRISDRVGVAGDDFSWLGLEAYESLLLRAQGQSFHHSPVWAATYSSSSIFSFTASPIEVTYTADCSCSNRLALSSASLPVSCVEITSVWVGLFALFWSIDQLEPYLRATASSKFGSSATLCHLRELRELG